MLKVYSQTQGEEHDSILAQIMGLGRPDLLPLKWRDEYGNLIDIGQHETERALQLRQMVIDHFGERSQQVLDLDRMIRWFNYKAKLKAEKEKQ